MEEDAVVVVGRAMMMEEGNRLMLRRFLFDLVLDQPRGESDCVLKWQRRTKLSRLALLEVWMSRRRRDGR
jgi:hypothetical protein